MFVSEVESTLMAHQGAGNFAESGSGTRESGLALIGRDSGHIGSCFSCSAPVARVRSIARAIPKSAARSPSIFCHPRSRAILSGARGSSAKRG